MTASSYDGRKPEPPYHTDSDIVVDLQGQIDELTAERDHLRAELQRLKSAASEGVESLIHNVAMAAWDAGCDSGVVWCPDADMSKRGIVPMSQEEGLRNAREHFAKHGSGSPVGDYESALNALRACLRSSPAPVVGGLPDFSHPDIEQAARLGFQIGASRLSSIKPGEVDRTRILEEEWCFPGAGIPTTFERNQDDSEGRWEPLKVQFGIDGDAWITTPGGRMLRFRNIHGGSMSPRTHKAIKLLAEAIHLDNQERPLLRALRAQATNNEKETGHD